MIEVGQFCYSAIFKHRPLSMSTTEIQFGFDHVMLRVLDLERSLALLPGYAGHDACASHRV